MRSSSVVLLLPVLGLGCDRTVEDGQWTFTWRLDGRELTSTWVQRYESCAEGKRNVHMMGHLRGNKDTVCWKTCTGLDRSPAAQAAVEHADEAMQACLLGCDAGLDFVSARCEPTSHEDPSTLFAK